MGEAFRDGERLGEAYGATKADVLKALEERHPEADEIRIRAARDHFDPSVKTDTPSEPMEKFFQYSHLPAHLLAVSKPFCELASHIVATLPRNPERTVALRKLLEAKDCAVRSVL